MCGRNRSTCQKHCLDAWRPEAVIARAEASDVDTKSNSSSVFHHEEHGLTQRPHLAMLQCAHLARAGPYRVQASRDVATTALAPVRRDRVVTAIWRRIGCVMSGRCWLTAATLPTRLAAR